MQKTADYSKIFLKKKFKLSKSVCCLFVLLLAKLVLIIGQLHLAYSYLMLNHHQHQVLFDFVL